MIIYDVEMEGGVFIIILLFGSVNVIFGVELILFLYFGYDDLINYYEVILSCIVEW